VVQRTVTTLVDDLDHREIESWTVSNSGSRSEVLSAPVNTKAVRKWAEFNGTEVSDHGRISSHVLEQYRAAGNQVPTEGAERVEVESGGPHPPTAGQTSLNSSVRVPALPRSERRSMVTVMVLGRDR